MTWPDRLALRPEGVVFDCDGLLVDTEPSWDRAEDDLFARRGLVPDISDRVSRLGVSSLATAVRLATVFNEPGREHELHDELLTAVADRIGREATALPGAVELVNHFAARGLPLAVASNSPLSMIKLSLGLAGLADAFDAIIAVGDTPHPKPAPDPYLAACARLGVDAAASVAFEDSAAGAAAAMAAGMAVVGVPTHPGEMNVHWQLPSLTHPDLAAWLASW